MSSSESQKRPLKKIVVILILAVAAGLGAKFWLQAHGAKGGESTFYGNVDIRDVTLAFRVGGRVETVLKHEGDAVAAGDVVARLEGQPYRVALEQARAAVSVAKAQLTRVEAGARREDITEARALLAQREAANAQAQDNMQRSTRLTDSGASTQQELVNAKAGADQARAAVNAAQATVAKLVNGARNEDIAVAQAQVAQAQVAVAAAELQVADTELIAPTAGVVATRAVEPGAIVGPGSPVFVVALNDPVWIRAFASEAQLARIAPGTAVDVYTDARAGNPYRGQVGYVATQAEFTPKTVETQELRTSLVYRFRVVVTEHDSGLRQGMPVTVRLVSTGPDHPGG